jgi:glycosyltransferase involved in cell wall biosynthesis
MQPLVSVGMPVFNCEKTLESSVKSILNQTYTNWELFLIDDGSKDGTLEIANNFKDNRIKVVSDGVNQQLPSRLNQAINLSNGKYFARMDGDDISYPERFQLQVEYLESHPEIDLLAAVMIICDEDGQAIGVSARHESHATICARPWYQYRPDAIRMEDYDMLLRSYQNSRFAELPDILFGYRVASLSLNKIFNSRYHTGLTLCKRAIADKNYMFAYGALEQVAKTLVDTFAITTGLDFKILRHRAGRPIKAAELSQWQEVWHQCLNKDPLL